MNERREVVRLNPAFSRQCLDPNAPTDPRNLPRERDLIFPAPDVFDHAVGKANIVFVISQIQLPTVPDPERDIVLRMRFGVPLLSVRIDRVDSGDHRLRTDPESGLASHIEKTISRFGPHHLAKQFLPACSPDPKNPSVKIVD
jgi:hypothetical protein